MRNHGRRAQGGGKRGDAVKRVESRFLEGRLIVPAIGFRTVFGDVVRISVTSFRRRRYRRSSARLLTFYENVRQQVALDFHLGSTGLQRRAGMRPNDINFRNGARQRHARPLLRNSPLVVDAASLPRFCARSSRFRSNLALKTQRLSPPLPPWRSGRCFNYF